MKQIELHTDGACSGNPGPGGWGAIVVYKDRELELSGCEKHTTNNRMELLAIIKGLESLKESCAVVVYSDSKYVVDAFRLSWIDNWQKKDWKNSQRKPVKNRDLWERMLKAIEPHQVEWQWVKGHAGDPMNERADRLATGAIDN